MKSKTSENFETLTEHLLHNPGWFTSREISRDLKSPMGNSLDHLVNTQYEQRDVVFNYIDNTKKYSHKSHVPDHVEPEKVAGARPSKTTRLQNFDTTVDSFVQILDTHKIYKNTLQDIRTLIKGIDL